MSHHLEQLEESLRRSRKKRLVKAATLAQQQKLMAASNFYVRSPKKLKQIIDKTKKKK